MIALAIALVALVVFANGLAAWLVHQALGDRSALAEERVEHAATTVRLEHAGLELAQTKAALAVEKEINDEMTEVMANAKRGSVGDGLAADDVATRMLRFARKRQAVAARDSVPAKPAADVSTSGSAGDAGAPAVPGSPGDVPK